MAAAATFVVTALEKDMPGEQAGLKIGDEILASMDSDPRNRRHAGVSAGEKRAPVRLELLRQNQKVTLTITPKLAQIDPQTKSYRIGFGSEPMQVDETR